MRKIKIIKRACAILAGTLLMANAHAGFVIGTIMSSRASDTPSVLVSSDQPGRDVITCQTSPSASNVDCVGVWNGKHYVRMSPAQFAKFIGYNVLYKVGFVSNPRGADLIIMEVGQ